MRFGFLEGDAIVHGGRVVYDPQSNSSIPPYSKNGSSAKALAIVLNQNELRDTMPGNSIVNAARALMAREHAQVIVVKCGPNGAIVLETERCPISVPAYKTSKVFPIGSGDVYSAIFAYYWGVEARPASVAADLASRSTAVYCSSQQLPIPSEDFLPTFPAANVSTKDPILVLGSPSSLASHWLIEETKWCLSQFGRSVYALDPNIDTLGCGLAKPISTLVLADTLNNDLALEVASTMSTSSTTILFAEGPDSTIPTNGPVCTTTDFSTALYWAAWS